MTQAPIKMYSTTWCGDCRRAKALFAAQGVAYDEIDIEKTPDAAALVMEHNDGKRRVPSFEIAGAFYGNPPISELKTLIKGLGA